jgi:cellulose biosynthesis protein BcsQ
MKIQLLIATGDKDYATHLSGVLAENYADTFDVTVCSAAQRLESLLSTRSFDVALLDPLLIPDAGLTKVRLPLLLWDASEPTGDGGGSIGKIRKYQRISRLSSDILEEYSKAAVGITGLGGDGARIVAVWSPAGGVGKTTAALAYAAQKAVSGGKITYLDLEYFSSVSVYFPESGKSISNAFERLGGNAALLLKAIALKDSGSGITYFTPPNNYDDMNELTASDIETLVGAASDSADEVVIDLPSVCDKRYIKVLEAADVIYLVTDGSKTAASKLQQFVTQHNLFEKIRAKTVLVANKGAKVNDAQFSRTVNLPAVSSADPVSVYKTLSGVSFE